MSVDQQNDDVVALKQASEAASRRVSELECSADVRAARAEAQRASERYWEAQRIAWAKALSDALVGQTVTAVRLGYTNAGTVKATDTYEFDYGVQIILSNGASIEATGDDGDGRLLIDPPEGK